MNNTPLVSVLMTAFNREKYIAEAIESVMASTYQNWELIIVDDKSKDRTVEIAKSFESKDSRIRVYVNNENLGDYPNRNRAASYAKGKYLKYLDSDDIIYPHGLEIFVYYMEINPSAALGLNWRFLQTEGRYPRLLHPQEALEHHFVHKGLFHNAPGSVIIKSEVFKEIGGFSGQRQIGDFECWLKIASKHPILKISFYPMWTRTHDEQEQKVNDNREKRLMKLITSLQFLESFKNSISFPLINELIYKTKHQFIREILKIIIWDFSISKALTYLRKYKNRNDNSYFSN